MTNSEGLVTGKIAVVTGAGRGIGREIALMLAAEGAKVVVNDVGTSLDGAGGDTAVADQVVEEIRAAGGEAVAAFESIAEWDNAQRIVELAVQTFGTIDIVVNNAGILRDVIFHRMSPDDWDAVQKVHLYGSFYISRAAATYFRKQERGALVHMTSGAALIGNLGQANYSAAKLGIVGLSRSIALDMSRFNVRSNCISPTAFSRMTEAIPGATPEAQAEFLEKRRKTRPDQIAPLAVFLASDRARGISGQIFGARGNEVYLYSQSRPIRTLHRGDGWTTQSLGDHILAALPTSLVPLETSRDVFAWDPL